MRRVFLCALVAAVVAPSGADAQSQSLTEAEALARLSSESPRVRAIQAAAAESRAGVLGAARWPNPRVTFNRESVAGVSENITMVTQVLPVTGRRNLEIGAATATADAASRRADEGVRRARADLRLAFADLVSAQVRERELVVSRDHLRELAEALTKREAAGDAAGFDRLRAERELVDVETDLVSALIDRARAQADLGGFFAPGTDTSAIVAAVPASASRPSLPDLATLVQRAQSARGDLLALLKEVDAANLSAQVADRRRVPEPEIVGGVKSSTAGTGDLGGVFAIHATLPLFDRNRADRAAAEARGALASARADALRLTLGLEIAALHNAVMARREAADTYRARAVDGAAAIERIAQISYDAGERTILELLDAYRLSGAARVRQAQLEAAVRAAEVELEYASGWELP